MPGVLARRTLAPFPAFTPPVATIRRRGKGPAAALGASAGPPGTGEDLVGVLRDSVDRLTAAGPAHEQHTSRLLAADLGTVTDMLETDGDRPATLQGLHASRRPRPRPCLARHFDHGAHLLAARYWMAALHNPSRPRRHRAPGVAGRKRHGGGGVAAAASRAGSAKEPPAVRAAKPLKPERPMTLKERRAQVADLRRPKEPGPSISLPGNRTLKSDA